MAACTALVVACGADARDPVSIASPTSTVTSSTTTAAPSAPSTTSTTTTTTARFTAGAPCTDEVRSALLVEARRWATEHAGPDIVITAVPVAQCSGEFAVGGMQCAYPEHPTWGCQATSTIFRRVVGEWVLIREGDVVCSTEPDPVVRAACAAVGLRT